MNETARETPSVSTESLSSLFHRAARFMARAHHHQGHAQHAQGRILSILKEEGALNQRDLLEILDIRSSSLSELLGKLERRDLITRERDEQDKRNYIITVTEQGAAIVTDREQGLRESADALFASLSEEERQQLSGLLRKLITAWEAEYSECAPGRDRHAHEHGHEHGHRHGRGMERGRRGRMHGRRGEPHGHGPHGHERGAHTHGSHGNGPHENGHGQEG